ncbi:hypothetical protein ACI2K4_08195 [Micromonospora sp. NPDC050397]|uniref:hypothetical protein n=1 Tax=Micromonospora sp. NPDC050397 TaxID=3364279 RepID=UPI00384D2900
MSEFEEYRAAVERRAHRDAGFRQSLIRTLQPGMEHLFEQLLVQVFTQLGQAISKVGIDYVRNWLRRHGWGS